MNKVFSLAVDIAAAHFSNPKNSVGVEQFPEMFRGVVDTLGDLAGGRLTVHEGAGPRNTALTASAVGTGEGREFLICLECGRPLKVFKRHLKTAHKGLTPDEYRAKHDLPEDYPMVAPDYTEVRSQLAKASGLGLSPQGRAKLRRARR